jgi:hypothetical protein
LLLLVQQRLLPRYLVLRQRGDEDLVMPLFFVQVRGPRRLRRMGRLLWRDSGGERDDCLQRRGTVLAPLRPKLTHCFFR